MFHFSPAALDAPELTFWQLKHPGPLGEGALMALDVPVVGDIVSSDHLLVGAHNLVTK